MVFEYLVGPATQAVAFFEMQIDSCRFAVNAWTLFAIRFGIQKGIRRLIGNLIWKARVDAKYPLRIGDMQRLVAVGANHWSGEMKFNFIVFYRSVKNG